MNSKLRTIIAYAIPVIILALFITIMLIEPGRTKRVDGDQYLQHIDKLQNQVQAGEWERAGREIKHLRQEFRRIIPHIQFSGERDEINQITITLAQIEAYVSCHDRNEAIASLYVARAHWANMSH